MMMRKNQETRAEFEHLPAHMKVPSLLTKIAQQEAPGEALLTDSERDYYVAAFARSGFTNPINWYRNWTTNWQALEGVDQVINIPTLFIGAVDDVFIAPQHIEAMKPLVTDLTIETLEPC